MTENSEQNTPLQEEQTEKPKSPWQNQKESWYDHLTVTVEQLNWVIRIGYLLLGIVAVLIALDAMGIIG